MKLLIVDDDVLLCSALSRSLIRLGHASRTVSSVDAALALVAAEAPVAVLTDLDLGAGGNGINLISRLRESGHALPALLMTGSDLDAARARLKQVGLDEIPILAKPFEFDELMRRLGALVPNGDDAAAPRGPTSTPMTALVGNVVRALRGRAI
jgi:two-component system response regulator PrrA